AGAVSFGISPLAAKTAKVKKQVVKYQESSSTGKTCKECIYFLPSTNECKLVEGKINPKGWCTYYLKKA
ncbi:MAG: high-potential iron-sulfur protein, partial [Sulfuricurvum sp.]